jgi:hypothetical protein
MKRRSPFPPFAAIGIVLAAISSASLASAQAERPIVVAYDAPPECASHKAFQELLEAEIARSPNSARPWRFAIRIEHAGDTYEGTLTTETGSRTVTSERCDDVTSALAVIVAVADADATSPPAPAAPPPLGSAASVPLPPPPARPIVLRSPAPAVPTPETREAHEASTSTGVDWRLSGRPFLWSHGPSDDFNGTIAGALGVFGVELPWGRSKMMFELGIGWASSVGPNSGDNPSNALYVAYGPGSIRYLLIDTQTCLLDLPLERTGLSVLGCLRVGAGSYRSNFEAGGAYWAGPGLRLRWQSPLSVFLEVGGGLLAGTTTAGGANDPIWAEGSASLGLKF